MVHLNVSHAAPQPVVRNAPCQHAFVLMGTETIFAVHMTQYHCDKHRYQVVLRVTFPKEVEDEYRRMRAEHPEATFVFCNGETKEEKFSIPALGAGNVAWNGQSGAVRGNIFFGFRPPVSEPPPPDWFPWNLDDTIPMIPDVTMQVERIVLYRPFSLQDEAPAKATYLLFGKGEEALMTNLQTGRLLTAAHEIPLFGLDVDHIMSLGTAPDWLEADMLEAGTVVTLPAIDRRDADGNLIIHAAPPFSEGDDVNCLYRGLQPPRRLVAGVTYFWSGIVCNSEELKDITEGMSMIVTIMPRRYWR